MFLCWLASYILLLLANECLKRFQFPLSLFLINEFRNYASKYLKVYVWWKFGLWEKIYNIWVFIFFILPYILHNTSFDNVALALFMLMLGLPKKNCFLVILVILHLGFIRFLYNYFLKCMYFYYILESVFQPVELFKNLLFLVWLSWFCFFCKILEDIF